MINNFSVFVSCLWNFVLARYLRSHPVHLSGGKPAILSPSYLDPRADVLRTCQDQHPCDFICPFFFPEDILQLILHFTNLLWAYLGLLILTGMFRSQHKSNKSLWDNERGRAIFAATVSQKRFLQLWLLQCHDAKRSTIPSWTRFPRLKQ